METQTSDNASKDVSVKEDCCSERSSSPEEEWRGWKEESDDDSQDVKDPMLLRRIKEETSYELDTVNRYIPQRCPVCSKVYTNYYILKNHMANIHINAQEFTCALCSKIFKKRESMKNHMRTSHECNYCGIQLPNRAAKDIHVQTHKRKRKMKVNIKTEKLEDPEKPEEPVKPEKPVKIKKEKKPNPIKKIFESRKEPETKKPKVFFHPIKKEFQCGSCKEFFTEKEDVFEHILNAHKNVEAKSFPQFTSSQAENQACSEPADPAKFQGRVERPKKKLFSCDQCNKIFVKEETLTKHMVRHREPPRAKLYQCLSCPKKFKTESFLKSHTKNYCNGKLTCPICQHFCTDANSFFNHLRSHDIVVGSATTPSTSNSQMTIKMEEMEEEESEEMEMPSNIEECLFCLEQFQEKEELQEHIANFHSEFCVESSNHPIVKTEDEFILP